MDHNAQQQQEEQRRRESACVQCGTDDATQTAYRAVGEGVALRYHPMRVCGLCATAIAHNRHRSEPDEGFYASQADTSGWMYGAGDRPVHGRTNLKETK